MALRDELDDKKQSTCFVHKLLTSLDAETSSELQELMDDRSITSTSLARLASKKGWNVGETSFQRHRSGRCKCL